MDELASVLADTLVTSLPEHPRFASYKVKPTSSNQEARRLKFLEAQKSKRYDYASHARGLATSEWGNEDAEEENAEMDVEEIRSKPPRSYKDQLMLSEWLVEVPSDLESQWWLMLCPVGKRCLIVASRGSTKAYTKSGYRIKIFPSKLPGGNRGITSGSHHVYSLLDCVFNETDSTYYILDVMCWNSHPCFDAETEFRFYWMHSKIDELPGIKEISKENPYKFVPLPYFNCDAESIKKALWAPLPFPSKLDGLLFYHKKTHYNSGTTPLVGWLKSYMVPEMLNIEIPNSFNAEKPSSYVSMQKHVPEAFEKHAKRKEEDEKNMQYEEAN